MADGRSAQGLIEFGVQGFRHLAPTTLAFSTDFNVIHGRNAAGKTSLLEAIYFLARSRSFITPRSGRMVASDHRRVVVNGRILAQGRTHRLGVQYQKGQTRVRLDGRDVQALSESAWLLPIQVINTEAQRLLTDGPVSRRAFVNWGVFHVEQGYRERWRRYQRALKQRNVALRRGDHQLAAAWEPELAEAGDVVDGQRRAFLNELMPVAMEMATAWLPDAQLAWRFRSGWPQEESLRDALARGRGNELNQGFGVYGPHRGDLRLLAGGEDAAARLSRGQQKLLVAALRIALVEHWAAQGQERPVVLVDDLSAELDESHRTALVSRLGRSAAQLFLTTIEPSQIPGAKDAQWFHVEQGQVRPTADQG